MKWVWSAILVLRLCAAPVSVVEAAGEKPTDFEARAPLTLVGKGPYYQLTLPIDAYLAAQSPDLRDLRVFNGQGDAVPFAMVGRQSRSEPALERSQVAWFPLYGPGAAPESMPEIRVERRADGTVVSVNGSESGATGSPKVRGYLLDASQNKHAMRALELDWDSNVTGFQQLSVESSDDLQHWHTWVGAAQLARLEYNGERIERNRIELFAGRADYLRLMWHEPAVAPTLKSVTLATSNERPEPLVWSAAIEPRRSSANEYEWEFPRRLLAERLRIALPSVNLLAPVEVWTRDDARAQAQWRLSTKTVLYRLQTDAREWQQDEVSLSGQSIRSLKIKVDARSGGLGSNMPTLAIGLTPRRIVFLARGDEPFVLALGNPQASAADLPLTTLIPAYNTANAPPISSATLDSLGAAELGSAGRAGVPDGGPFRFGWRTAVLWTVLLIGVATIAAMALYLLRQMKA
jgi:hypothetical protein